MAAVAATATPPAAPAAPSAPPVIPVTQNQLRAEQLIYDLWNDSEFGPKVRALAKKKFNDIKTVDDDPTVASIRAENADLKKKFDELQEQFNKRAEERQQAQTQRELEAGIDAAQRKFALTEEGRIKMLDLMKERRIFDPEAAAALVAHSTIPEAPKPTWQPTKANLFGSAESEDKYKKLHTNPDGFLDDEFNKFFSNPDEYVAETNRALGSIGVGVV